MKKSLIFALCLIFCAALVLTGCGKSAAEKAAEKLAESATNGQADVDIDHNTVTINTNAGTLSTGENVSLPASFPSDVYVIDGTIKWATTVKENESYSVSLETTKSVTDAKALYEKEMQADSWTSAIDMTVNGAVSLGFQKDNRTVTVIIAKNEEEKTQVSITTAVNDQALTNSN